MNPREQEFRLRQQAKDCFLRAAAVLVDGLPPDAVGEAIYWGALGLVRLASSDPEQGGLAWVEERLRKVKRSA